MEENARARGFIERLLRHQAFTPFLEELSRDEALQGKTPLTSVPSSAPTVVAATSAFQSQQFGAMSQSDNTHVGVTMVPEPQIDFSVLNLNNNGNNWGVNNSFGFQPQPSVFAVHELPEGPINPLDTEAMSGKGYSAIFSAEDNSPAEEVKMDYPVIERPMPIEEMRISTVEEADEDEDNLYASATTTSAVSSACFSTENHEILFSNPEKALSHFSLVISDETQEALLAERLARRIAAMEPVLQRVAAITSMLDS